MEINVFVNPGEADMVAPDELMPLDILLEMLGFDIVNVPGDGSCLFWSLGCNSREEVIALRQRAAQAARSRNYEKWNKLAKPRYAVFNNELHFVAEALQRPIFLVCAQDDLIFVQLATQKTIQNLYANKVHNFFKTEFESVVYECGEGFREWLEANGRPVCVLLTRGHYQKLVLREI